MRNLSFPPLLLLMLVQVCSAAPRPMKTVMTSNANAMARSTAIASSSSSSSSSSVVVSSIPRGGIVPLMSPDVAVKAFLGASGLNAITGILTPAFHLGSYDMQVDAFSSFMAQECCGVSLNICILLGLQQYSGMKFEKAVGWSTLPYICMTIAKLVTDKHATVNTPHRNGYSVLIINVVGAITSLSGHALADPIIKYYAINSLINGIPFLFAPKTGGKVWDLIPESSQNTLLIQWMGYGLLSHFVSLLPAFGLTGDTYKIVGLVTATITTSLLGLFGIGKLNELQLVPVLVWIALLVSITLSLL